MRRCFYLAKGGQTEPSPLAPSVLLGATGNLAAFWRLFLVSSGCLAGAALGGLYMLGLLLYTGQLGVDHDTAAVLANDDFLAHADIKLTLSWPV